MFMGLVCTEMPSQRQFFSTPGLHRLVGHDGKENAGLGGVAILTINMGNAARLEQTVSHYFPFTT